MPDHQIRLPTPGRHPALTGPLGGLVLQPWFDHIAPYWISRWIFPHQRALAAAIAAGGAPARFAAATGLAAKSHPKRCIGPKKSVKFFCGKDLTDSGVGSDANRVYLRSI